MYPDPDTIAIERIDVFLPCGCEWIIAWTKGKVGHHCVECLKHKARWTIEIRDGAVVGVWRPGEERKNPAEDIVLGVAYALAEGVVWGAHYGLAVLARADRHAADIKRRRQRDCVA